MADPSFEPLKLAVDLSINGSNVVQAWITRFVAVNAALFTASGFMLTWNVPAKFADLAKYGLVALCLLGAIASLVMGGVTLHQIAWGRRLQERVLALQKERSVVVHPDPFRIPEGAYTTTFVIVMLLAVSVAWVVLGVLVLYYAPIK